MTLHWLWLVGLLALPGLLTAMILRITWQNRRTRRWPHTMGRIVESRASSRDIRSKESRLVTHGDPGMATVVTNEQLDRKNFADIAYEYGVAGRTFRSRQVAPGIDPGNLDVVEMLRRYPKGKVVTVHYDPDSPGDSILQRDDPRRLRAAWLGIAILTVVIVAGFVAFDQVVAFVQAHVRNPKRTPLVLFALVLAFLLALMAWATIRRARTMRAWPTADGVVVSSYVDQLTTSRTRRGRTSTSPVYAPRVIYRFRVESVDIDGDQLGRSGRSSVFNTAQALVAAYPAGTRVVVHYDPDEPTTAIVDPTAGLLPLGLGAGAVALAAIAWALAVF
ncbi:MAG TPA: DUF3592 domain-containing protein [Vineibacter sp.]|nr:DUF3592 domain-containing protein [Vineibacter sp.]